MKTLVIYHSVQGNTERAAKLIAAELQCDIVKINDADKTNPNLIRQSGKIIGQLLQRDSFKPAIERLDLSSYDRIYVGSPCWNYTYTPAIGQFLKTADYKDKEIIFFLTHGGGPGRTIEKFQAAMVGGIFKGSMDFAFVNRTEENELRTRVKNELKQIV